jgi:tripartite ATP-independent transporter DctM subunit
MNFEWLAVAMFVGFFFILMTGYPVAFSFAGAALLFGGIGLAVGAFDANLFKLMPNRWFGTMSDFTLLAIPYFIFLGAILEKSGLAEDLLESLGLLFGPVRGGIAIAVVIVGTLLAATTGVVAATVIMMGMMSLPVMLRYGYDKKLAAGVIVASGTLAQLIPPSLVLIVLSDQIGVSVGDMFLGAFIPGLILAGSFLAYVIFLAIFRPHMVPAIPLEMRTLSGGALTRRVLKAVVPPIILIFLVLGTIFFGIATPTEAGAVGSVGAMILAAANRKLTWTNVMDAAKSTARISGLVMMIIFASSLFSIVFDGLGGKNFFTQMLLAVPGGVVGFLIMSNIAVFLLGIFLEFMEICFIVMPLFVPAAQALGIDLAWFGVMMAVNLQAAFISPPVGFSLFYLQGVAPKGVSTADIHRSAFPFMALQVAALLIVALFPQTVQWLIAVSGA